MDIINIFLNASVIVQLIILFLLFYSIVSWAIIIQKYSITHRATLHVKSFETRFWEAQDLNLLYKSITYQKSYLTGTEKIFYLGYKEFLRMKDLPLSDSRSILEGSVRAMNLAALKELERIRKNLSILAVISSSSPYIGLFGTVYGIMSAFMGLAAKQSSLQTIAPGIAEALIATAMGLFAAIPSVIAYNMYANRIDILEQEYYNFVDEFTAVLDKTNLNDK